MDDVGGLHCCEHSDAIYQIIKTPDPASSLVLFSVRTDSTVPTNSANVLVDLTTGAFKILGADYIDDPRYIVAWLPEERVVWADDKGEMYIGSLETQESLNVPARMTDLWFVPPDRILARDEALQFWYLDLADLVWTQLPEGESEKITWSWIDHAAVSDDSDYVFFFFENYTAILSNDSGTVQIISPFISPAEYYVIIDAMEDDTLFPPQQIKGTPYWFFRTAWVFREFSQISYLTKGFIVDSGTGEVVGHDILDIPSELALYDSYLSPDRMWVAMEVVEAIQTLETYPAQVSQTWFMSFPTGEVRVEDGEFAGWDAESQAYLHSPLSCTEQEITIDLAPSIED